MHESQINSKERIFSSRFVDELKEVTDTLCRKSRLVAQYFEDDDESAIPTKAPTEQGFSQRVGFSIAAAITTMIPYTRDINQGYIQSHSELKRLLYIRATMELCLPDGFFSQVVRPLYGIPEFRLD